MQRLDLGPIVIGVIATGGGDGGVIVVVVVTVGIKRTIDVVNLALSARDLHFIPWRAVFAGLHREHFHFLLETKFLRHRANLRVLLLFLLLCQSFLPRIPGTANRLVHLRQRIRLFGTSSLNLNVYKNLLIDFLSPDHTRGGTSKRSSGSFRCLGRS